MPQLIFFSIFSFLVSFGFYRMTSIELLSNYCSLQLKDLMLQLLNKQKLSHGEVQAFGTPRRLVVQLI